MKFNPKDFAADATKKRKSSAYADNLKTDEHGMIQRGDGKFGSKPPRQLLYPPGKKDDPIMVRFVSGNPDKPWVEIPVHHFNAFGVGKRKSPFKNINNGIKQLCRRAVRHECPVCDALDALDHLPRGRDLRDKDIKESHEGFLGLARIALLSGIPGNNDHLINVIDLRQYEAHVNSGRTPADGGFYELDVLCLNLSQRESVDQITVDYGRMGIWDAVHGLNIKIARQIKQDKSGNTYVSFSPDPEWRELRVEEDGPVNARLGEDGRWTFAGLTEDFELDGLVFELEGWLQGPEGRNKNGDTIYTSPEDAVMAAAKAFYRWDAAEEVYSDVADDVRRFFDAPEPDGDSYDDGEDEPSRPQRKVTPRPTTKPNDDERGERKRTKTTTRRRDEEDDAPSDEFDDEEKKEPMTNKKDEEPPTDSNDKSPTSSKSDKPVPKNDDDPFANWD